MRAAIREGDGGVVVTDEENWTASSHGNRGRTALFERLAGRGQVWMTGTEAALFDAVPDRVTRFEVADGVIRAK